jgi:hypothetical protein
MFIASVTTGQPIAAAPLLERVENEDCRQSAEAPTIQAAVFTTRPKWRNSPKPRDAIFMRPEESFATANMQRHLNDDAALKWLIS